MLLRHQEIDIVSIIPNTAAATRAARFLHQTNSTLEDLL
jgi:hypothetical protein